jgi:ABC-type nitrate/sulfonate/bicarbonate transport system permease component
MLNNKWFKSILYPILMIGVVIVFWECLRNFGFFKKELLPNSVDIGQSIWKLFASFDFWQDFSASMYRTFYGLFVAVIVGIPLGFLIGSNRYIKPIGTPMIDFLRSIPVTSLYPVFVLTLGIDNKGKIGMIFLGCVLVIMLHTITGFDNRSRHRHLISKLYGATKYFIFFKIILFETLPNIITGIRVAIGYALIITTLTEMFMGAANGIGQSLMESYSIYNLSKMYAYIFILGLIGYGLNQLIASIERNTLEWKTK